MSPSIRFDVDSLEVNTRAIVASLVVSPESTVDEVMVIVGADVSYVNDSDVSAVAAFPAESLTATEKEWLASDSARSAAPVITAVQLFEVMEQV